MLGKSGFSSYVEVIDRTAKKIQLGLTGCGREKAWFHYSKITIGLPPNSDYFVGSYPRNGYEYHIVERLETFKK